MGSQSFQQMILPVQMSWLQPPPHCQQELSTRQSLRLPQQTVRQAWAGRSSAVVVGKLILSVLLTAGPAMSSESPSCGSQAYWMTAHQLERAAWGSLPPSKQTNLLQTMLAAQLLAARGPVSSQRSTSCGQALQTAARRLLGVRLRVLPRSRWGDMRCSWARQKRLLAA